MRKYGAYQYSEARNHAAVEVGETHVVIRIGTSSEPLVARILGRTTDPETGDIIRLILDRLVTSLYETTLGRWKVSGAYVTELSQP